MYFVIAAVVAFITLILGTAAAFRYYSDELEEAIPAYVFFSLFIGITWIVSIPVLAAMGLGYLLYKKLETK